MHLPHDGDARARLHVRLTCFTNEQKVQETVVRRELLCARLDETRERKMHSVEGSLEA